MTTHSLLDSSALATYLAVPLKTVERWRYIGTGPQAIKIGRHIRYRRADVDEWVDAHQSNPGPNAA